MTVKPLMPVTSRCSILITFVLIINPYAHWYMAIVNVKSEKKFSKDSFFDSVAQFSTKNTLEV